MKIFISHASGFDYNNELYVPLRSSDTHKDYEIILPFETRNVPYEAKQLLASKKCDVIVAECSYPSTGQGIELGWANVFHIPILCIYKKGSEISGSLKLITDNFIEYEGKEDMVKKVASFLKTVRNQ